MLKKTVLLLLFVFSLQSFGQNTEKVSLNASNTPLKDVLLTLENQSKIRFFYDEAWLKDQSVTASFSNEDLEVVLKDILKDTPINYIYYDGNIILTNNSVIYKELPNDYFGAPEESVVQTNQNQEENAAVFINEYTSNSNRNNKSIQSIGKQNLNSSRTVFTVSGYIRDAKTNQPIQNVAISIPEKNINTTTDANGYYTLQVPKGFNSIVTTLFGYSRSVTNVAVYGDGSLSIKMQEGSEQLDEVVIQAKKDDVVKSAVMGLTTIDVAAIKTIPLVLGERDLFKVATTLPGITTAGEGSAGLNVRGGRTDQNLILLDDAVIYNPAHFLGFFSAINPFTTGSVDIYKASIPAEFGGRLSSVFDIKTKDGNIDKFSGEGSIGPVTGNLALEIPIVEGKSSLITGFRATYSDYILKALDEEALKNSNASFFDTNLKYKHKINENNDVQASIYYSKDKYRITGDSLFNYSNRAASLKWNHKINDRNSAEFTIVNSQYKFNIDFEGDANRNFDFGYKVDETQIKANFKHEYNSKHKFDYGISSKLYNIEPGEINPSGPNSDVQPLTIDSERGLESALYITDTFEVNENLLLNLGIRYSVFAALGPSMENVYEDGGPRNESTIVNIEDYGSNEIIKTYGGPEYRMSLRYFLSPSLSIKGSYNKTLQYIHLLSNNTTEAPTDTWKLSDFNIGPQKAHQFALGLYKNVDDKNLVISLEAYYKIMKDILDYKIGSQLSLNENIEQDLLIGEGKAYGVEFLLKKTSGRLNGWFGYTYSRSFIKLDSDLREEIVNNGEFFPANYDKPHDFSVVANYKLTERYSISANLTYQTGRPITYPIGNFVFAGEEQVLYSDRNEYRIPDYYRLDLGVNIEGNHKIQKLAHSFWNISVYNVLGRNNPYSVFFVNDDGQIQAFQTSIFAIPIPTVTYNFKF